VQDFFPGGEVLHHALPNVHFLDLDGLAGRLRSSSYIPQEGHANFAPMMDVLRELFRGYQENGRVRVEYATHLYAGRLPTERK
jgi:hypothetical protein